MLFTKYSIVVLAEYLKMAHTATGCTIILLIHVISDTVFADFEQTCTNSDYTHLRQNQLNMCGSHLSNYVYRICEGRVYLGEDVNRIQIVRRKYILH